MNLALAEKLSAFEPTDDDWLELQDLLDEAFTSASPKTYYASIFHVFEQFPADDVAGVFWSALHGMEQGDNYQAELLKSHRQRPSLMSKTMLTRMRNAGELTVDGVPIDSLIGPRK